VKSPPDGYTLLLASTPNTITPTLYDKLNFNFIRDMAPVASIRQFRNSSPTRKLSPPLFHRSSISGLVVCGRSQSPPRRDQNCCRTSRPWLSSCRAMRRVIGLASAHQTPRRLRSCRSSTMRSPLGLRCQNKGAACRAGWRRARALACRLWRAHRRGHREVGQGGKIRGH
jgi:hypothetical protein